MSESPNAGFLEREVRIGLQVLALSSDEQLRYHAPACMECELFGEFMDPYEAYISNFAARLTHMQRTALAAVADALVEVSSASPERPMLDGDHWSRLRALSVAALGAMNWPVEPPPPYVEVSPGTWHRA